MHGTLFFFDQSPVYELQYLYGTIAAFQMNAEMGTKYDTNKMMNWCFNEIGTLRRWQHTLDGELLLANGETWMFPV